MRTTRAFIAGLGTTGSLVAAAACAFLVASAVIAFRGWPGTGFVDRIESVFVDDEPPVAWDQPGTAAVATSAVTGGGAVGATAAGPPFGAPGVVLGDDGGALRGGTVSLPDGTLVPGGAAFPAAGGSTTGSTPGGEPPPLALLDQVRNTAADTVRQTGAGAGGAVRDATRAVGDTVGGPVGDTVSQTGGSLGDTVDGAAQGVGDLLRP